MSTEATQVTAPDTSSTASQPTTTTGTPPASTGSAPETATTTAQPSGLDFIPEAYRNDPSFSKYKSQDEFFKGFQNLTKMVGQKQIVNGLQIPGETASEEEISNFHKALGRPEAADKYTFEENLQAYEGFDSDGAKKTISEVAFKLGFNQKQVSELYKAYVENSNAQFGKSQEAVKKTFDDNVKAVFGNNTRAGLDQAKRGAKALGVLDTLNLEDISDPLTLRALAKLGEFTGEDTFIEEPGTAAQTKEQLLAEARKIQASEEYRRGDKALHAQVEGMYKKAFPN